MDLVLSNNHPLISLYTTITNSKLSDHHTLKIYLMFTHPTNKIGPSTSQYTTHMAGRTFDGQPDVIGGLTLITSGQYPNITDIYSDHLDIQEAIEVIPNGLHQDQMEFQFVS